MQDTCPIFRNVMTKNTPFKKAQKYPMCENNEGQKPKLLFFFTCQFKSRSVNLVLWVAGNTAGSVSSVEAVHLRHGETPANCHNNHHLPPAVVDLM